MTKILTIEDSRLLFSTLGANGMFSSISGVLMLLGSRPITQFIGLADNRWIQGIGAVLILFGGYLIAHRLRRRISRTEAILISIMDFAWVGGSAALLLLFPGFFSAAGVTIVIGIAAVVFIFFELQAYTLWRTKA
jgi:hypothetical protein